MKTKFHDENGKIVCQECRKPFQQITFTHLKHHGMTLDDYKAKYENYPLTSESFRARQKFKKSEVLGKIPIAEELLDELVEESEALEDDDTLLNEIIEEAASKKEEHEIPFPEKRRVFQFLRTKFPNIENNYFIEKKTIINVIEYRFVTDMADPVTMTDFEFDNAGWHNKERYEDPHRDNKLKKDGWKIFRFRSVPTIKKLGEAISE